jgi:ElaB/YqjD/DUF883 family membrane-anchored ribosome-binding protein
MATQNAKGESSTMNNSLNSGHPVTDKVADALHTSVNTLTEKAASAEKQFRDTADSSVTTVKNQSAEMQDKWNQSRVKRFAAENPVATAGIAFATGALIASFFSKK